MIFDDGLAVITPSAKGATYIIKTTNDLSFRPIYNLLVKELKILRNYLSKATYSR
jgi:hypothetical protein